MTGSSVIRPPGYLESAERHAGRALSCRGEIAVLLRAAADPAHAADFDQALFLAKFCEKAGGILRRTGPGADDVQKLAAEFSDAMTKLAGIIAKLFDAGDPVRSGDLRKRFLPPESGSIGPLRLIIADLALLKNYELHEAGR